MLKDPQHQRDALQKENKLLVKNEETKKNDISKSFAEIEERLDRLVKENDKLKKEIERLSEENNELKNKDMTVIEKEFTGNTDSSRKEIEKLNSDIEEHKRIVKELNVNMEGLKKENEKLCSDIEVHKRTEKELHGNINSLKNENEKHYSDVEAHTRVYNNEKEYVLGVSQSIHNLVLKIKESKSNVNSFTIEPTQNEFKDKLNDKMKKILNDVVVLKNELLRCQEAMQNEKMKMTELQTQKNDLQKQSQHFYQENAELNESLQQKDTSLATIKTKYVQLKIEAEQSRKTIKELKTEKDDLQTRLSSFAGDMLTKGNPAITDLGDPNRPMKIGEKYVELYDNEWTDAMEITDVVREIFSGMEKSEIEEVIIHHLYRLLTCCYQQCIKMSEEQIRNVVITLCLDVDKDKPDSFSMCKEIQEILAIRRRSVDRIANSFFQNRVLDEKMILQEWNYVHKSDKLLLMLLETPFYEKCVNLCWSMVIQDPVMYLDEELSKGTQYDKYVYREYTRSGNLIQYVVWPAIFLHKGGPLLFKGVVQVYRDETNIVTAV